MGTYDGLAIPLHGGFTCKTEETTPIDWLTVTDVGACKFLSYAASANNFGIDIRMHLDWALGGQCLKAYMYHDSLALTGQAYAAFFQFIGGADAVGVGTGRAAALMLYMNLDTAWSAGGSPAAVSWINYAMGVTPTPAFFVMTGGVTADESGGPFWTADNTVIDHALRIYIENVAYYIGLYDALCT